MKYTWKFNKCDERWSNDRFNTIEECKNDARKKQKDNVHEGKQNETIYIAECIDHKPQFDTNILIDALHENAFDDYGEAADGWNLYETDEKEQKNLKTKVNNVIHEWLEQNKLMPDFYELTNLTEHEIKTKKYIWCFNEHWFPKEGNKFNTIEECIADAKNQQEYKNGTFKLIHIGEYTPYQPDIFLHCDVLDKLKDDAVEVCGDDAENWELYDMKTHEIYEELENNLTAALCNWLEKYDKTPKFYSIEKTNLYDLLSETIVPYT